MLAGVGVVQRLVRGGRDVVARIGRERDRGALRFVALDGEEVVGYSAVVPGVGWSSQWVKRGVLLIGWTVGVGIVDPPDSTYSACEQSFVVCRMDAHDVPWCSDAITLARVTKCVEGDTGLDDAPSAPSWAPDGRTFRIEGRRFRIEAGGWDK